MPLVGRNADIRIQNGDMDIFVVTPRLHCYLTLSFYGL